MEPKLDKESSIDREDPTVILRSLPRADLDIGLTGEPDSPPAMALLPQAETSSL